MRRLNEFKIPGPRLDKSLRANLWWITLIGTSGLALLGWLVWRADQGEARALDSLLLTILGLVASVVVSVWLGKWSAQKSLVKHNKPFLRAAFRSHGELILGLGRLEQQIAKASEYWIDRLPLSAVLTLAQEQSLRAYEGLQNWRELLPEGVAELENKLREKRTEEEKVNTAISEIMEVAPYSQRVSNAVKRLMEEKERLARSSPFISESPIADGPRRLLLADAYDDAINAYSQLINENPANCILYVARARAKYLAGDKAGALMDLEEVERIQPGDLTASRGVG